MVFEICDWQVVIGLYFFMGQKIYLSCRVCVDVFSRKLKLLKEKNRDKSETYLYFVVPSRFELELREPESLVLPLHYGTILNIF